MINKHYVQYKILEGVTETIHDRMNQYTHKKLSKINGFNYEKLCQELIEDIETARDMCRKLEK